MRILRQVGGIALLLLPLRARAISVLIDTGVNTTIPQIMQGLVNLFLMWSFFIATAIFLMGAALMVGSGGKDEFVSNGKKLMKASLIGLAIVLASWMILSSVVAFIAG